MSKIWLIHCILINAIELIVPVKSVYRNLKLMHKVITRFAPSPTGMLHIGGARTALFNYLFAKKHNGLFLLRIEDTDIARSTLEACNAIMDGLSWLGLSWDGDVLYQSKQQTEHCKIAEHLVENGSAYYAYDDQEQIAQERADAIRQNKIYRYNPIWRDVSRVPPPGIKPAIRLKVPNGETCWQDLVRGDIRFDNADIDDFVLLRSDGMPTYMLAVVCDDVGMNITHVIRGDDHISNTPKQILIYNALREKIPFFGHIPLIYDADGQKLSKRKGAVAVKEYESMGYLPEAVCSYLMQLGWASKEAGNNPLTVQEAAKIFDIKELGRSPSRFDFSKLGSINIHYIQTRSDEEIVDIVTNRCSKLLDQEEIDAIKRIAPEIKKSRTINEVAALGMLFTKAPFIRDADAAKLIMDNLDIKNKLLPLFQLMEKTEDFELAFDIFLKENSLKFGVVGPILRSILIGKKSSLGIMAIVNALGKQEILKRFAE